MPGSPEQSTTRRRPVIASSSDTCSRASSFARPNSSPGGRQVMTLSYGSPEESAIACRGTARRHLARMFAGRRGRPRHVGRCAHATRRSYGSQVRGRGVGPRRNACPRALLLRIRADGARLGSGNLHRCLARALRARLLLDQAQTPLGGAAAVHRGGILVRRHECRRGMARLDSVTIAPDTRHPSTVTSGIRFAMTMAATATSAAAVSMAASKPSAKTRASAFS